MDLRRETRVEGDMFYDMLMEILQTKRGITFVTRNIEDEMFREDKALGIYYQRISWGTDRIIHEPNSPKSK